MLEIHSSKDTKKQQIIDVAIDLFAERGIAKVSFASIARVLGATKGMVYYYFPNGKTDIIDEMLQIFEKCVKDNIPSKMDWQSTDADVENILSNLFFSFPEKEAMRLRKITRIIMSEMYFNDQIATHMTMHLLAGREKMLADCLTHFADNGKIVPLDAESAARCLNRLVVAYAIEDALNFPFEQMESERKIKTEQMFCDCRNIIDHIILRSAMS